MRHLKNQIITDTTTPDASNVLDGELVVRIQPGNPGILLKMADGTFASFIDSGAVSTALENITTGSVDLTNYYKKDEADNLLAEKVDKESGKGLSSNDYSTEEKEKLAGLSNYDDTEIRNALSSKVNDSDLATVAKTGLYSDLTDTPTIPTKTSELTNDSGFLVEHQDISGKADKADTLAGYGITDAYTKSETDTLLESYRKKTTVDFIADTGETTVLLAEEYLPVISGYTALTITLPAGSESDGIEYNIQFTAPDEGLVLNVPDTIKWNGGLEPVINSGSTYQISILNNLAVIGEF